MNSVANSIGLDYPNESVQVCVMAASSEVLGNRRCPNDWEAIARYGEGFGAVGQVAIESCTGAADLAEELVTRAGWSVTLGHPGYVRRMKQNPDKTDYFDAKMLADLARVGYLPRVWLAPREVRELRRLVRYRHQLVDERRNAKLRIRALLREHRVGQGPTSPWTVNWMKWLGQLRLGPQTDWVLSRHLRRLEMLRDDIREVEKRLAEVTAKDAMVERLRQLPGIGLVALTLLDRTRSRS